MDPEVQRTPVEDNVQVGQRPKPKSLFIKTFGCQMNVYDSDRMSELLAPFGYGQIDAPDSADMVILNTCHIRERASEKLFSELGRLRLLKQRRASKGNRMIIAVAGCVAQAAGEEIIRRAPQVDIVVGPQTYQCLPELVARAERAVKGRILYTEFPAEPKFDNLPTERHARGVSAFLSVQEGCDKFCTFCVVPYTRGSEYSRPVADLVAEAEALVEGGVREIVLLGQNVNAYHGVFDGAQVSSLSALIERLSCIEGLARIRYTTSHPCDMDSGLIEAHRNVPTLMPSLHLPVQSGSNRILREMNRGYGVEDYRHLIDRLRASRPDIALSSDFIVGFPGETEADFEATMTLVKQIGFAQAYSFKYSPRPGTPAAVLGGHVDEAVKTERLLALQTLLANQQQKFNDSMVGKKLEILLEKLGRYPGQFVGRSPYLQPVHVAAKEDVMPLAIGDLIEVTITESFPNSLSGTLVAGLRRSRIK